ncbi:MAG TPA: PqiC family protein [Candidatus Eisenbacteria bacterium]|nr:PqiC family protein [Candidatus Eisenbacteria bacterium]
MTRIGQLLSIAMLAVTVGCSSPHSRFYTLAATATPDAGRDAGYTVAVGPISIPAYADRPELVVQVAPHQVKVEEYDRWAAPLEDDIARVVAGDLQALLGTPRVAVGPMVSFVPAYRVTIDVQRFESTPGDSAVVEAVWVVEKRGTSDTLSGRTIAHEAVDGKTYGALAAAHSRAVETMSRDIAEAIRTLATKRR